VPLAGAGEWIVSRSITVRVGTTLGVGLRFDGWASPLDEGAGVAGGVVEGIIATALGAGVSPVGTGERTSSLSVDRALGGATVGAAAGVNAGGWLISTTAAVRRRIAFS
jgi:hypothetical protein